MNTYIKEECLVISSTVLSLITAWSWNSVLQNYIKIYHNNSMKVLIIYAIIITILTIIIISNMLHKLDIDKEKVNKIKSFDGTNLKYRY